MPMWWADEGSHHQHIGYNFFRNENDMKKIYEFFKTSEVKPPVGASYLTISVWVCYEGKEHETTEVLSYASDGSGWGDSHMMEADEPTYWAYK